MTNIYFNRWFSVAYLYMDLIRNNPDGRHFSFYGTHPDLDHMSLRSCDYREAEPVLEGTEYVDYAVEFCRVHHIDVFIPRLKMLEIAREISRFDQIGTKVMVCRDIPLLESMIEKDKFYQTLQGTGAVEIPDYYVAETAEQFKTAYDNLVEKGWNVCFKPTNAEGGMGFRIINNNMDLLANLYSWVSLSVPFEQVYRVLSAADGPFPKLMVMEQLEGDEYSIDCLADAAGNLLFAIPRRKGAGRIYTIEDQPELQQIAHRIAEQCRIPYAFNIQVKYNRGIPKLLEINPRMSGGVFITCLSGVNIPYLAVQTVLGETIDIPQPQYGIKTSYIEQPILL